MSGSYVVVNDVEDIEVGGIVLYGVEDLANGYL